MADFNNCTLDNPFPNIQSKLFQFKGSGGFCDVTFDQVNRRGESGCSLRATFHNPPGGFGGWAIPMNGYDLSTTMNLSFWSKGENGDEKFEIGIKSITGGVEREHKVHVTRYTTLTTSWQKITIPLADFNDARKIDWRQETTPGDIDFSSIDNVNIGFNDRLGDGLVYIEDLCFTQ